MRATFDQMSNDRFVSSYWTDRIGNYRPISADQVVSTKDTASQLSAWYVSSINVDPLNLPSIPALWFL